jgi:transcriptional regulator with XRE-family HTH domain
MGKETRGLIMPRPAKTRRAFAERFIRIRKAKGITQTELAKLAGVSQRVVALYETTITHPSADIVLRLARALDLSVDQLLGRRPIKIKAEISRNTLKKAKMMEELPPDAQKSVMNMIDTLHTATRKT